MAEVHRSIVRRDDVASAAFAEFRDADVPALSS